MKIVFWLSLTGILYTYMGYPAAMWMLARLRPRPWKAAPIAPSVSIVLAVHNGIALLPRKIQHLLGLDYPNIKEIIVVSDGSTDGTAELLVQPAASASQDHRSERARRQGGRRQRRHGGSHGRGDPLRGHPA